MSLSGEERKNLQKALIAAFPSKISLEQMLSFELDKNLNAIAGEGSLTEIVFKLIKTAEAENWVENLINAARKSNPGNRLLKNIVCDAKYEQNLRENSGTPEDTNMSEKRNINTSGGNYNERIEGNYCYQQVNNYGTPDILPLRQGMLYEQARQMLIDAGWQTTFNRFASAATDIQTDLIVNQKGWVELESCSGTGLGLCSFQFKDAAGRTLRVVTANNFSEPNSSELKSTVFQWFFVKGEEDNL